MPHLKSMCLTKPTSTQQILRDAQSGDDAALDELISRIQPQLQRLSMRMCGHTQDAEDVVQDSLLAMARNINDFRADSALSTWMYTIARRFCIKRRAKKSGEPKDFVPLHDMPQVPSDAVHMDPDRAAQINEQWRLLQRALMELDLKHREVFVLREIEGLSTSQAAQVLELTPEAVKSRLHRARKHVRATLFSSEE